MTYPKYIFQYPQLLLLLFVQGLFIWALATDWQTESRDFMLYAWIIGSIGLLLGYYVRWRMKYKNR